MRKISEMSRRRQIRLTFTRHKRRLNEKRKRRKSDPRAKIREIEARHSTPILEVPPKKGQDPYETIYLPEKINLSEQRDELLRVISTLEELVFETRCNVRLNFIKVQDAGAAGLLFLTSQLYRLTHLCPGRINGTYPQDQDIAYLMKSLGFFRMLGVRDNHIAEKPDEEHFRIMKFKTGMRSTQEELTSLQNDILDGADGVGEDVKGEIYGIMVEAMENVCEHAYEIRKEGKCIKQRTFKYRRMRKRWWNGACLNRKKKSLLFMMCDHGAGIPETLPERFGGLLKFLEKFGIAKPNHGDYIERAMALGESQTKESHRGVGLHKMKAVTKRSSSAELRILSGGGEYVYHSGEDGEKQQVFNHSGSKIEGTVVLWSFNYETPQHDTQGQIP